MQCIPERVDSVGFTAGQAVRCVPNNIPISNDRRAYFGQRSGDISRRAIAREMNVFDDIENYASAVLRLWVPEACPKTDMEAAIEKQGHETGEHINEHLFGIFLRVFSTCLEK